MNTLQLSSKRLLSLLLAVTMLFGVLTFTACNKEPVVIKDSDTCIVINVPESAEEMTLIDYMETLKADGTLDFTLQSGMVTSIGDIENTADFSQCWMLYTSDADNANSAWGTVEYDGNEYGSAVVGAEALTIKPGCLYIWVYMSF